MKPTKIDEHLSMLHSKELLEKTDHLRTADRDRSLIVVTHAVIERLLGDIIEIGLPHPEVWLPEADFRSRTNLASALGLISDHELKLCRVLNSARNCAAHELGPLPDKWRTEILRIAFGKEAKGRSAQPRALEQALDILVTMVAAPWLYLKVSRARGAFVEEHRERWIALMDEELRGLPDHEALRSNAEAVEKLCRKVDAALVAELSDQR